MRLIFLLLLIPTFSYSQQTGSSIVNSIAEKMDWYNRPVSSTKLFVHFDKNIYTNNENVWLAAYLLKSNTRLDTYNTLCVAVIRNADRSILAEEKFVMKSGLAAGNFTLPDSLPTGDYTFIAYTNRTVNGYPDDVFVQPVTIKTAVQANFVATLTLTDSLTSTKDSVRVLLRTHTRDIRLIKDAQVAYVMGDSSNRILFGKSKTNNIGEVMIYVPVKKITAGNNILKVQVRHENQVNLLQLKFPVYRKAASVKFYPEGGYLVNATTCRVGWEAKNAAGQPLKTKGILYNNDLPIDTFETGIYGMGTFEITPAKQSSYKLKLLSNGLADTSYLLPPALDDNPVLSLPDALSGDKLLVNLYKTNGRKMLVLLHNYRQVFAAYTTNDETSNTINLSLNKVPKGITAITVLDSAGRPLAERLFFAHYSSRKSINFTTNGSQFATRDKVHLKFSINNNKQSPVNAVVSVACVQDNRIDTFKMIDIESWFYLDKELQATAFCKDKMDNRAYLENLLLIKGWRKYTWPGLMDAKPADTLWQGDMTFKGIVKYDGKPVDKPAQVGLLKMLSTEVINTDSAGKFQPSYSQLIVPPLHKLRFFINNNKRNKYTFTLTDPYSDMNEVLSADLPLKNYTAMVAEQNTQTMAIKKEEGAKLPEVVVSTVKTSFPIYGRNECGDYVCGAGIFNCPNHFEGILPVKGQTYRTANGKIVYAGCKEYHIFPLKGIYTAKEFYRPDYDSTCPPETDYASTLYWNPAVITNKNGEVKLSFSAGDIAGKFKIIVQGITGDNDVVAGTYSFIVK